MKKHSLLLSLLLTLSLLLPSLVSCADNKPTGCAEKEGDIVLELYPDVAPITVENFVKLTNEGFYDGLTFHRAISGFMIQGGDPNGDGTGNSETTIKGEFRVNGFDNTLAHKRGVISMARSNSFNSASCQFFICNDTSSSVSRSLDGLYAAFGMTIEGLDIIDAITNAMTPYADSNGTVSDRSRQVKIVSVRVIDNPTGEENNNVYIRMHVKGF